MLMESKKRRRCERSAAVQEPELEVMDGRASLAMTGQWTVALRTP